MPPLSTVVFADLTGSTGVFEALGNVKATQAVTRLTQLIGEGCVAHRGRVVKNLGDGVLAVFSRADDALAAVVQLQREHDRRIAGWPPKLRMQLRTGVATGEIVEHDGDCFGEAVNLAARLSDLCGDGEIWATGAGLEDFHPPPGVRVRPLGLVAIRGLAEPRELCRVDWRDDSPTEMLTMPAPLPVAELSRTGVTAIELTWLDTQAVFPAAAMPVHLGRLADAEFAVGDPRVSRQHARIDWVNGHFTLTDLSSYGTWVRFDGAPGEVALRRGECVLAAPGEIALGASFSDFTTPTVRFSPGAEQVALAHRPPGAAF
jgi:class 3 adenylate cyclase